MASWNKNMASTKAWRWFQTFVFILKLATLFNLKLLINDTCFKLIKTNATFGKCSHILKIQCPTYAVYYKIKLEFKGIFNIQEDFYEISFFLCNHQGLSNIKCVLHK